MDALIPLIAFIALARERQSLQQEVNRGDLVGQPQSHGQPRPIGVGPTSYVNPVLDPEQPSTQRDHPDIEKATAMRATG